jgi:ABC-type iron transport system FetAB permease component
MILGNAISAIGVGMNTVHKEFAENRDKVETYLAMGASRFEACKPIGVEALKLALLPTVNQLRYVIRTTIGLAVLMKTVSSASFQSRVSLQDRAVYMRCDVGSVQGTTLTRLGMMTGAIVGGKSVEQAARLQSESDQSP